MDRQSAITSLSRGKLFEGLGAAELGRIVDRARITSLERGALLVGEHAQNDELFVVLTGSFEVFLPKSSDRFTKLRLATLGPGACIGEYSFIDKQPTSAAVAALEPSQVLSIAHGPFEELLQSENVIGRAIYENLLRLLLGRLRAQIDTLDLFRPAR